jgi:hypothetical protein
MCILYRYNYFSFNLCFCLSKRTISHSDFFNLLIHYLNYLHFIIYIYFLSSAPIFHFLIVFFLNYHNCFIIYIQKCINNAEFQRFVFREYFAYRILGQYSNGNSNNIICVATGKHTFFLFYFFFVMPLHSVLYACVSPIFLCLCKSNIYMHTYMVLEIMFLRNGVYTRDASTGQ